MKKVVNVNLGGNAYQLEEDGFDALAVYLEAARASLAGNPDLEEIISDLELSIADKMNRFLGRDKTVVTTSEIEEIVDEMGPVDGAGGGAGNGAGAGDGGADPKADAGAAGRPQSGIGDGGAGRLAEPEPRKLFKLTGDEEKMLAGVCAGLAAYSGVDVTIVRIGFLALIFATSGLAIIAYLALAIVIPVAKTPAQQAQAYGVPFDARGVIDRARSRFDDGQPSRRPSSRQTYRNRHARAGFDGVGSLLGLLVVLFAIFIGLWLFSTVFVSWLPSPVYMGRVHYVGWPWWMTVFMIVAGVFLIGWIFGDRDDDDQSRLGSLLVRTIQVFLILFVLYLAYRTLPFVREPVNALMHFAGRTFW
jgi:phage shock protein PspC (stress-responsive transcriptional regulator)